MSKAREVPSGLLVKMLGDAMAWVVSVGQRVVPDRKDYPASAVLRGLRALRACEGQKARVDEPASRGLEDRKVVKARVVRRESQDDRLPQTRSVG